MAKAEVHKGEVEPVHQSYLVDFEARETKKMKVATKG